jgi:hypothetical protein
MVWFCVIQFDWYAQFTFCVCRIGTSGQSKYRQGTILNSITNDTCELEAIESNLWRWPTLPPWKTYNTMYIYSFTDKIYNGIIETKSQSAS